MKITRSATMLTAAAGALVLTLAGCSGNAGGESEDGVTTINYWSWDGAPGEAVVTPMIEAFEAANPDIKVTYTEIPQGDYKTKVAQSLGADEDIDVLGVQPSSWAEEIQDYLLPVSEWADGDAIVEQFQPATIDQTSRLFADGELMALPLYSTGSAVGVYNADILAAVGATPPTTWAEFKALSDALEAQGEGILPAVMPGDDWFQDEASLTVVGQVDPEFFNDVRYDEGSWNTPGYVEGLTAYSELFNDGTFDRTILDMDYGTAMTTFEEGKAAVAFNGSWETGRILDGNYGVIPFPAESAEDVSLRAFLDVLVGVPAASTKQEAAAKFAEFISAGDGVDEWASALKGIPAVADYTLPDGVLTTELQQESYQTLLDLINNPRSDRNNMGSFSDFVGGNVKQAVLGAITPQEAADADQAELEKGNF
jgi:raffinose/stachyose/melibiose transport system substrate-binding protein